MPVRLVMRAAAAFGLAWIAGCGGRAAGSPAGGAADAQQEDGESEHDRPAALRCSADGWCVEREGGPGVRGLWGTSDGAVVFAVGEEGMILRREGSRWSAMESGVTSMFTHVWGAADDDVFAIGSEGVLHFDGAAWSVHTRDVRGGAPQVCLPGFGRLWGSGADDVYAAAYGGALFHYDGAAWSPVRDSNSQYNDVSGSGRSDVWVVGLVPLGSGWARDNLLHFDGTTWTAHDPVNVGCSSEPTTYEHACARGGVLVGVAEPGYVVTVTLVSSLCRYDGTTWCLHEGLDGKKLPWGFVDLYVHGVGDIYLVGQDGWLGRYNGVTYRRIDGGTSEPLCAVWGTDDGHVYAGGGGGLILHRGPEQAGTTSRCTAVPRAAAPGRPRGRRLGRDRAVRAGAPGGW